MLSEFVNERIADIYILHEFETLIHFCILQKAMIHWKSATRSWQMFVHWHLRVVVLLAWRVVLILPVNPRRRLSHKLQAVKKGQKAKTDQLN